MIDSIFVEGLIYGIMVMGVFITFRILDFPDLTVDGSFPLGASVMTMLIISGHNLLFALIMSLVAGFMAGIVTALIHNILKVPNLLAGILTMTMLYSVNIRILGNKANIPIIGNVTILTSVNSFLKNFIPEEFTILVFFIVVSLFIKILLDLFFHTDMGLLLRAMGNNQQVVLNLGVNPDILKIIGVGLSNGLVALSGAFAAQYLGFSDVNLGQGVIISGLASVMIGEVIVPSRNMFIVTLRALIGSIVYKGLMYAGRVYGYLIGLTPNDLKLITGLLIILALLISNLKNKKIILFKGGK
jgi:putative tryptophan/tyrosine transport system permease protein